MTEPRKPVYDFPTTLSLKAIGWSSVDFVSIVADIIRRHAPDITEQAITERPSSGGKYTSVTITITVKSQPQIDAIFRDLSAQEQVIIVL